MIKSKFFHILTIALFSVTTITFSQGGSNYSILGIGDINYSGNASFSALGGTQIAFPSENSINLRNPSMWGFVTSTRLQAGYKFNQNIVSGENQTVWHNNGSLSGFSGIFAIDSANRISASLGIVPYSSINYLTSTKISVNDMGLILNGETVYQGTGGISQAYIGLSTGITEWFGVGASIFSSFGVIESNRKTSFQNDLYTFDYTTTKSDFVSGWGFKSGAYVIPTKDLIVGFSLEGQPGLSSSAETNYKSATIPDTTLFSSSDIEIPILMGIGVSYSSGNFIFGGDLSFQDFSNFKFNPGANTEFTNSIMASIGVNRIGNPSLNANFLDRISYKFGAGYNQLYYKVLNNQITEYLGSFGMQMPFSGSMIIDATFSLGYRKSGDTRLVNEYFGRFGVDISIGEVWFKPFFRDF